MTGNISYLSEYEPYDGGYVSFGHGGGKITGKVVVAGTSSTNISGTKEVANQTMEENVSTLRFIALPNWIISNSDAPESSGNSNPTATAKDPTADQVEPVLSLTVETEVPTVSSPVPTDCLSIPLDLFEDTTASVSLNEVEADLSNMETDIQISLTPTLRIHKVHPKSQIISLVDTPVQTRQKTKNMEEQSFIATIHQKTNPKLLQCCLFSCFLSQEESKKIFDALKDPSWVEAMQEELLQFKVKNVWVLVDCPKGMDVKSAFLYGSINEEVYVKQTPGFQDSQFPDKVYKVVKAMYGLHQAPRAWYGTLSKYLLDNGFQRGLQVLQKKYGIFLSQDKYVFDILKKFGLSNVWSANTPMDREHPWGKDGAGNDVELYLYRSMIGSLMYLTASRPDIMFVVCACARHQVTPKECHLRAVKRIFSDYSGSHQDRKSTTEEYVAAASGCGQVLWIQN
ncbi:putative reverse transcriptase, RNA-dependent DNA polymerase [Tanacetum coccineum]